MYKSECSVLNGNFNNIYYIVLAVEFLELKVVL